MHSVFLTLLCVADENAALAGKLGVMQSIVAGIDRHATVAPVAEQGFWALANICANGYSVTENADLQEH
ncbi:MAG: hypothetical protein ACK55I_17590 [bacterium]